MRLIDQERTGLLPEHTSIAPLSYTVRATIPVLEALGEAGATVERIDTPDGPVYRVTLGKVMPAGIVAAFVNGPPVDACLRMEIEPEYPGECEDYWRQVDWTPCPVCGAPVVWYEAAYVPGYRVCSQPPHHHSRAD